jgi:RHS repeat-associated protein
MNPLVGASDHPDRSRGPWPAQPRAFARRHTDTQAGVQTLRYDAQGQIATIEQNGQLIAQYTYNQARQRVSKTVYAKTSQKGNSTAAAAETAKTTYFTWHGGLLDAEIDAKGQVQRRYIYLGLRPVAVMDYTGQHRETTQLYAIHVDHLGTPQALTDAKQTVVWQARYNSFGRADVQALAVNNDGSVVTASSSNGHGRGGSDNKFSWIASAHASEATQPERKQFEFNLRFAGQYQDAETGYHYNWNRYYDPHSGRYITPDPIGLQGGANAYGYVGADPFGAVDPEGLVVEPADVPAPYLARMWLGREVHSLFSDFVLSKNPEGGTAAYGANNTYEGTFGFLDRPDTYLDDLPDRYVWELKPISNKAPGPLRSAAITQVNRYINNANRLSPQSTCGGWAAGPSKDLFVDGQQIGFVKSILGDVYGVTLRADSGSNSGLVFYELTEISDWQTRLSDGIRSALNQRQQFLITFPWAAVPIF